MSALPVTADSGTPPATLFAIDEIRLDPGVLDREHAPGATESTLDLVGDQDDAVAVAQAPQPPQQLGRRRIEPAFAQHRLDDDRCHARRVHIRLEQLLERLQRMLERDAVIQHRVGQVVDLRQHRPKAGLVGLHLAGETHARQRAAVEAARERDHGRALGMKARDLDGVLDRLRAGGQEYGLFGTGARGERVQLLRERDVALVRRHLKAGMYELFQLPRDRLLHLGVHVAGVEHRDAAGEVDIAPPLDVPDLGVAGTLGVHRERVRDAARDGLLAAGVQFGVRRQGASP